MKDSALVVLLALRHYGYYHAPQEWWGSFFSIAGAACLITLLTSASLPWPIKGWAIGEELLVAGCNSAWLVSPWDITGTDEMCSARLDFKLGAIGLAIMALAIFAPVSSDSINKQQGGRK